MVFCFPKAMAEAEAVLEAARGVRVASKQPPQTQSLEGDLYWKISSIFSREEEAASQPRQRPRVRSTTARLAPHSYTYCSSVESHYKRDHSGERWRRRGKCSFKAT